MEPPCYHVADWRFDPSDPFLRREGEDRRLEDRAARTLAELCRRRGAVVSKAELIATVWAGRAVSENSVSIVVGDLRRALGDDPRDPAFLVTVARRGYRLMPEPAIALPDAPVPGAAPPVARRSKAWIVGGACALGLAGAGVALRWSGHEGTALRADAPSNATGQASLDRLAGSLAPVVVDAAARLPGVRVVADGAGRGARVVLRSRLILWNGAPELALSAVDTRDGIVIWTGFAAGPPDQLARHVTAHIQGLSGRLPR